MAAIFMPLNSSTTRPTCFASHRTLGAELRTSSSDVGLSLRLPQMGSICRE